MNGYAISVMGIELGSLGRQLPLSPFLQGGAIPRAATLLRLTRPIAAELPLPSGALG